MWLGFYLGDVYLQRYCSEMVKKDFFVNLNDNIFFIVQRRLVQSLLSYLLIVNKLNCDFE